MGSRSPSPSQDGNINDHDGDQDCLIIGLDFGTTFSGIAYAFSAQPDHVYPVVEWPGAPGRRLPKTPTVMRYNDDGIFEWGYELDSTSHDKIVGLKLLLDPDQKKPAFGTTSLEEELEKLPLAPVDIAADYIAAIYKHALKEIEKTVPKEYFDLFDKKFVLSVPAVWSDKAKDTTLRAARNAGIAPIELIKEPEAAALFTLHQLKFQGLSVGDAITVCDAGGGTVDLVSYEILQLNPLELKELVPSTGGVAGSLMLNRRFEEFVENRLGSEIVPELKEKGAWAHAMRTFDQNAKPAFQGLEGDEEYITFPLAKFADDHERGILGNTLIVTPEELYDIFEPVVEEIDGLIKDQVSKVRVKRQLDNHPKSLDIKAIFLVGGFGSNNFLRECIVKSHPDIQVIQPNNAWEAIVQGAVLSKLLKKATVVSSIAEQNYGIVSGDRFDAERDTYHHSKAFWDHWEEVHRIQRMKWYIEKGDDLRRDRSVECSFYSAFPADLPVHSLQVTYSLKQCSSEKPPEYPDSSVKTNCTLKIDLSDVPRCYFNTKYRPSDGRRYHTLDYKLLVKVEGARLVFSFKCKGKEYGSVIAEY